MMLLLQVQPLLKSIHLPTDPTFTRARNTTISTTEEELEVELIARIHRDAADAAVVIVLDDVDG